MAPRAGARRAPTVSDAPRAENCPGRAARRKHRRRRPGRRYGTGSRTPATLRIWYGSDDPTESPLAQSIVARFQSAHPGVTVNLSTYGLDDINDKLALAVSGGSPPDLVYTTPRGPGLPVYVKAGKLLDLTSAARRNHWDTGMRGGSLAAYNDLLAPNGRAAGHVYAAPSVTATVAIMYNKTIFQRLHLAVPRSLADFETLCKSAKAAGLTAIGFGNADGWVGDDWYLTLVNALAGPASLQPELRLDPNFTFDGPAFQTAGATMQRWARSPILHAPVRRPGCPGQRGIILRRPYGNAVDFKHPERADQHACGTESYPDRPSSPFPVPRPVVRR